MQLANIILCLGGSLLHTVPKIDVTPAEILILRHIHGDDAVTDIRPTSFDDRRRQEQEWQRLANAYDRGAGAFTSEPGDENAPILSRLFPGAMKQLPVTFADIGMPEYDPPKPARRQRAASAEAAAPEAPPEAAPAGDSDTGPMVFGETAAEAADSGE